MNTRSDSETHSIVLAVATACALLGLLALGCGGGGSTVVIRDGAAGRDGGAGGTGGATTDGGFPAPPALGAQIDRMGRPAVTTALIHAFDPDMTAKNAAKDAYNAALPATWPTFAGEIAKNLAIYDSLDTNCHNQFLHSPDHDGADRYAALSLALADDQVILDTTTGTCMQYLGVELKVTGAAPTLVDCGGRTPLYDVIDVTYSALAIGATSGVTDGVDADDSTPSTTIFPFLAAP
jgi:hypothetical protein